MSELHTAEGHRALWAASCLINKFCCSVSEELVSFFRYFGFYLVSLLFIEQGWKGSRVLGSVSGRKTVSQARYQSSTE